MKETNSSASSPIPGYDYGALKSAISPLSDSDMLQLERTAADAKILAQHANRFRHNVEEMVDSRRSVIGAETHLSRWCTKPDGKPDGEYKACVKLRFGECMDEGYASSCDAVVPRIYESQSLVISPNGARGL